MIRATININNNIQIETYGKLQAFLKPESKHYVAKKSKIFSSEEISDFLNKAPDEIYLLTKVWINDFFFS